MTAQAALFDLDGTLVASGPGIMASVRRAMAALGHDIDPGEDLSWVVGPPLADVFARLLTPLGQAAQVATAMARYRGAYKRGTEFEFAVLSRHHRRAGGVPRRRLDAVRRHLKPQDVARRILAHDRRDVAFRVIYGAIDDIMLAHKPELLAHIIGREALDRRRTVMIGDRSFDIAGAHANDLRAVGVLWGYGGAVELQRAGADAIAGTPAELLERAASLLQSGSAP